MSDENSEPSLIVRILENNPRLALWVGRNILKMTRLEKIKMVDLAAPIQTAIDLYGEPLESTPNEEFPEATVHTFRAGPFHEAVIYEWQGLIHLVTYWSEKADPTRDLAHMFLRYGDGVGWNEMTKGYNYMRSDRKYWLWCSAIPAIGIQTAEYQVAEREYKKADQA